MELVQFNQGLLTLQHGLDEVNKIVADKESLNEYYGEGHKKSFAEATVKLKMLICLIAILLLALQNSCGFRISPSDAPVSCGISHQFMVYTVRRTFLQAHNEKRALLAEGGEALPPAANMRFMTYNCSLEKEAIKLTTTCKKFSNRTRFTRRRKNVANIEYRTDNGPNKVANQAVSEWWNQKPQWDKLQNITEADYTAIPFFLMAQADIDKVGCSVNSCKDSHGYESYFTIACIYGKSPSNFCYQFKVLQNSDGFKIKNGDARKTCGRGDTVLGYQLRKLFLQAHNEKRASLAKGEVEIGGKRLSAAANMRFMKYDCQLEEKAVNLTLTRRRFENRTRFTEVKRNFAKIESHDSGPNKVARQMAQAETDKVGCAVRYYMYDNKFYYAIACFYGKEVKAGSELYQQSTTACTNCTQGYECDQKALCKKQSNN
ncbi:unnamed protein product [Haemonchus placei]|uniref:SCP domain-containing protein n=1 Tax=Haemonchus placei TaxID=6290 RepID=A0A0N4X4Y6_HAEPC|nr:unnamed protein product [Haemonchus placei]